MSIDLHVNSKVLPYTNDFRTLTLGVLKHLINVEETHEIKIGKLEDGIIHSIMNNTIMDVHNVYCLQYKGREDNVFIVIIYKDECNTSKDGFLISFEVGSTRNPEEYVLGLAGAIAMGIKFNSIVEDGQSFWTKSLESDPNQLLEQLAIKNIEGMTFSEACKLLVGNRLD